jgi:hypothetical protein
MGWSHQKHRAVKNTVYELIQQYFLCIIFATIFLSKLQKFELKFWVIIIHPNKSFAFAHTNNLFAQKILLKLFVPNGPAIKPEFLHQNFRSLSNEYFTLPVLLYIILCDYFSVCCVHPSTTIHRMAARRDVLLLLSHGDVTDYCCTTQGRAHFLSQHFNASR